MSRIELKRLWAAMVFVMLAVTAPSWLLKEKPHQVSSYDAPWIYPADNPSVQAQLQKVSRNSVPLSFLQ